MKMNKTIGMLACSLFIAAALSSCATNKGSVSSAQLETFTATWSEYKAFHAPMEPKDELLLLAALEKDPKGPWAGYVSTKFAQTRFEARGLDAAGRTAHYKEALGYLEPACAILAKAVEASPKDKELQQSLNMMKGLVSQAALEAGFDLATVKANAEAALANNTDKKSWNYGNKIYKHHTSLGRAALRKGNIEEAKKPRSICMRRVALRVRPNSIHTVPILFWRENWRSKANMMPSSLFSIKWRASGQIQK